MVQDTFSRKVLSQSFLFCVLWLAGALCSVVNTSALIAFQRSDLSPDLSIYLSWGWLLSKWSDSCDGGFRLWHLTALCLHGGTPVETLLFARDEVCLAHSSASGSYGELAYSMHKAEWTRLSRTKTVPTTTIWRNLVFCHTGQLPLWSWVEV